MRTFTTAAALVALLPTTIAQANQSYQDYNVAANPDLFPLCLQLLNTSFPDCTNGPLSNTLVCDQTASPHDRASGLVSLFTFEELVNNTGNTGLGVPRLGLPNYQVWGEALHGVGRANFPSSGDFSWATSFPMPINTMSALNRTLIHQIGSIVSTQLRAFSNAGYGGVDVYSPNINTFRHPVWGRGQETPGEDVHLSSVFAYEYITALQGGVDPETLKIIATAKHYAGYDIESWNNHSRLGNDMQITQQELSEYYTPPFLVAVRDAKVRSVMCSYNSVNGVPSCSNSFFLQTLLRDTFEFHEDGYVSGDCGAVYNVWNPHGYAANESAASADSILAGTDIDCGTSYQWHLEDSFEDSHLSRSDIERGVIRLYANLVQAGYFDGEDQPYRDISWQDVIATDEWNIAYEAAVEGTVLLKNDGTLPLSSDIRTVAVIGPWANVTTELQGNYFGPAPYLINLLNAFQESDLRVLHANGTAINSNSQAGFKAALKAARQADAIIFAGGIDNTIEAEAMDREDISWPGNQLELIDQLSQLRKPLIVLQMGGGQVDSSSLESNDNVNALVWGGYPGQSGGQALFDIITGKRAPAGRLVVTQYPAEYALQFPAIDMNLRPSGDNPGQTYMWYTGTPVYEFGHGLFYTTFEEQGDSTETRTFNIQDLLTGPHPGYDYVEQQTLLNFTATITNTGDRESDYTAIVYVNTTAGSAPYPNKWLVGFDRLGALEGGDSQTLTVPVSIGSVARTDEQGNRVLYPGRYELALNNDRSVVISFDLEGEEAVLLKWPEDQSS
ncbi:glycosyl hydrolase family 3 N terminal domain-containing protein [Aspergillus cavernicola]|uniref:xylan 1,4-beta-xylosidase n=1 Tax=Aspergillus cavernicola TaxID=176166 RepID=A0ABR4HMV5_9EURO